MVNKDYQQRSKAWSVKRSCAGNSYFPFPALTTPSSASRSEISGCAICNTQLLTCHWYQFRVRVRDRIKIRVRDKASCYVSAVVVARGWEVCSVSVQWDIPHTVSCV